MINTLSISIPVPCVQGKFGSRLVTYSTQIAALDITTVLGHDPRAKYLKTAPDAVREIYQRIQRPTSASRRDSVMSYIEQRLGPRRQVGAFPAISIGLTNEARFESIAEKSPIGHLHITGEGHRIVLDGLGRLSGCLQLAEEEHGRALVQEIVLPVTFYLPAPGMGNLSIAELGQLFMDFNFRVYPVPARIAIALDQSDIYISLANRLAKEPFIENYGGMEQKAASLGKNSTALVVQSVLLRVVRGACEGRNFQESNLASTDSPNLKDETFDREFESIANYFSQITARMGERWGARDGLHLTSPGWQALGIIHHDIEHRGLNLSDPHKALIYDAIADIDWSRSNKKWVDEAELGQWLTPNDADKPQVVMLGAGRNNTQAIIDYLELKTGLKPLLYPAEDQKPVAT